MDTGPYRHADAAKGRFCLSGSQATRDRWPSRTPIRARMPPHPLKRAKANFRSSGCLSRRVAFDARVYDPPGENHDLRIDRRNASRFGGNFAMSYLRSRRFLSRQRTRNRAELLFIRPFLAAFSFLEIPDDTRQTIDRFRTLQKISSETVYGRISDKAGESTQCPLKRQE